MKVIRRRVCSKNPKVQILTLELVSRAVDACGLPVQTLVAGRDFVSVLTGIGRNRDTDPDVLTKLLSLAEKWAAKFIHCQDSLPGFTELSAALGCPRPSMVQLRELYPKESPLPAKATAEEVPVRSASEDLGHIRMQEPRPRSSAVCSTAKLSAQKVEKLRSDLAIVTENVTLANEMLDAAEPADLIMTLQNMQGKLSKLIETIEEENILGESISAKDAVDDALSRYQALRQGAPVQRATHRSQQPDILPLLHLPPELYTSKGELPPQVPSTVDLLSDQSSPPDPQSTDKLRARSEEGKAAPDKPQSVFTDLINL